MKERQPIPTQATEGKTAFELAIEAKVGDTIESIREMSVDERRKLVETKHGSPMKVVSYWPFIGRNEPPQTLSREEVDKLVDEALK